MTQKTSRTKQSTAPSNSTDVESEATTWEQVLAAAYAGGRAVKPFKITDDLILQPPSQARAKAMRLASTETQAALVAVFNIVNQGGSTADVQVARDRLDEAELAYTKALFGEDKYDAVQAHFADADEWERKLFAEAVKNRFAPETNQ